MHSTWLVFVELMLFVIARSRKHIHCIFVTFGRRKHVHYDVRYKGCVLININNKY